MKKQTNKQTNPCYEVTGGINFTLSECLETLDEFKGKSFKTDYQSCFGHTNVATYNWFWFIFNTWLRIESS